jgi:hypothetical protein
VFDVKTDAIHRRIDHLRRAYELLPAAHLEASKQASEAVRSHLVDVADEGGRNHAPLEVRDDGTAASVVIADGPEGDELFDAEYGTDRSAPNPMFRNAVHAYRGTAHGVYKDHLTRGIGISW